jgi:hypothetical protein
MTESLSTSITSPIKGAFKSQIAVPSLPVSLKLGTFFLDVCINSVRHLLANHCLLFTFLMFSRDSGVRVNATGEAGGIGVPFGSYK